MQKILDFTEHTETIKALNAQLTAGKISHAYLFCGSAATQKEELAATFANAINSENETTNTKNQNHTYECGRSNKSADICTYYPNSARGYLVEQIRDIIADAQRAPIQSAFKINVITHAEKLTTATANAFLKTLEEPPAYVVNILLAENADDVLPTIVSRCQLFELANIPQKRAEEIVAKNSGAALADVRFVLHVAHGSITEATRFLQDQQIMDLINFCRKSFDDISPFDGALQAQAAFQSTSQNLTDYQVVQYSSSILKGIDEITKSYATKLDEELSINEEFLDGPAIKTAEKQNKRKVAALQVQMLQVATSVFAVMAQNILHGAAQIEDTKTQAGNNKAHAKAKNQQALIKVTTLIDDLFLLSQKLSYNISPKNYCDVLLLKIAHANDGR